MDLAQWTARFWSAAHYTRRHPDRPQKQAQRLLREVARYNTGALQQRALSLIKDDDNEPGPHYAG